MPHRGPPRPRRSADSPACSSLRRTRSHRSQGFDGQSLLTSRKRTISLSRLGRTLYCLQTAEGAICAGRVWQGTCLLLFTSPAAASAFADMSGVEAWPPLVFSRNPSEFWTQAVRCFGRGFIGGLIDPIAGIGKTELLEFDVDAPPDGRLPA